MDATHAIRHTTGTCQYYVYMILIAGMSAVDAMKSVTLHVLIAIRTFI